MNRVVRFSESFLGQFVTSIWPSAFEGSREEVDFEFHTKQFSPSPVRCFWRALIVYLRSFVLKALLYVTRKRLHPELPGNALEFQSHPRSIECCGCSAAFWQCRIISLKGSDLVFVCISLCICILHSGGLYTLYCCQLWEVNSKSQRLLFHPVFFSL